jgi:hypothetical protein
VISVTVFMITCDFVLCEGNKGSTFSLLNPSDFDGQTKSLLQVLEILYIRLNI